MPHLRQRVRFFVGLALLFLGLITAAPAAAQEPAPQCVELGDFRLSKDELMVIQDNLLVLGISPGNTDGLMGPVTRAAIQNFCQLSHAIVDRTPGFESRLGALLEAYAALPGSKHKAVWKSILDDAAFWTWVESDPMRSEVMQWSGSTQQIVDLLDEWIRKKVQPGPVEKKPVVQQPKAPEPIWTPERIHAIRKLPPEEVTWEAGKGCGCLRDYGNREVYGFFRYWSGDAKPVQFDFGALSRIGYFAVPLDADGIGLNSENLGHWSREANFVKEARRFNSKVDLVVYNDKWESWKTPDAAFVSRLAGDLAGLVLQPLTTSRLETVVPYLTVGPDPVPTVGDGITLFLNMNNPSFAASDKVAIFGNVVSLINDLKDRLNLDGGGRKVSVLLQMSDFLPSPSRYALADVTRILEAADLILVTVDAGNPKAPELLRFEVESVFANAVDEQRILRKIIPTIDPSGLGKPERKADLDNNITYFEDNFGGTGFLPATLAADTAVNAKAQSTFADNSADLVSGSLALPDSAFCAVVCPNGWMFYGGLELLLLIGGVMGILWLVVVEVRLFFSTRPYLSWIWGGLTLAIGASLFMCDKTFKGERDVFLLGLILLVMIAFWLRWVDKRREAQYP